MVSMHTCQLKTDGLGVEGTTELRALWNQPASPPTIPQGRPNLPLASAISPLLAPLPLPNCTRAQEQCLWQCLRTPEVSVAGALTGGPREHSHTHTPIPTRTPVTQHQNLPASCAPRCLPSALQTLLSSWQLPLPGGKRKPQGQCGREGGREKSEAHRTAWRRRLCQLAGCGSALRMGSASQGPGRLVQGEGPGNLAAPVRQVGASQGQASATPQL